MAAHHVRKIRIYLYECFEIKCTKCYRGKSTKILYIRDMMLKNIKEETVQVELQYIQGKRIELGQQKQFAQSKRK